MSFAFLAFGCGQETNFFEQTQLDTFAQAPNNKVDILWVIDDSNSMAEEQQQVAEGIGVFAAQMETSGTDFQLGVTSTSVDAFGGALIGDPPFLTNADTNYQEAFRQRALIGTEGSDKEKGLAAAALAVSATMIGPGGLNEGFVRPDAQLLVVFVSDEEDCSDNGALAGEPATTCYTHQELLEPVSRYVVDLWNAKGGDRDLVNVGAIVGTDASACADEVWPTTRYREMVRANGGIIGDICQASWDVLLADLGLNAVGIRSIFKLTKAAEPETIVVTVNDVEVAGSPTDGWTYDPETWYIEFHGPAVPERGASIAVSYTVKPGVADPGGGTDTEAAE